MDWIDQKYIGLIGIRLERFAKRGNSYNFRCPLCGDSQKNKYKTRGYIVEKATSALFYCHNCGASMRFGKFLEHIDSNLAADYNKERFEERYAKAPVVEQKPDISKVQIPRFLRGDSPLKQIKKISQLVHDHPAKKYVSRRQIPTKMHHKLFYAPKFKTWVNTIIPDKFDTTTDEPRLIIPFLTKEGECYGFQGRSFDKNALLRYITIMIDPNKPKVFGLDTVDTSKTFYILEGPIDSMFIENSIAMAGADVSSIFKSGGNVKDNAVFVYDNEPRNSQIVGRMEQAIQDGYKVCIWPSSIEQKDVNDMVLAGRKPADVQLIIDVNTYSNLSALAHLSLWSKV